MKTQLYDEVQQKKKNKLKGITLSLNNINTVTIVEIFPRHKIFVQVFSFRLHQELDTTCVASRSIAFLSIEGIFSGFYWLRIAPQTVNTTID